MLMVNDNIGGPQTKSFLVPNRQNMMLLIKAVIVFQLFLTWLRLDHIQLFKREFFSYASISFTYVFEHQLFNCRVKFMPIHSLECDDKRFCKFGE